MMARIVFAYLCIGAGISLGLAIGNAILARRGNVKAALLMAEPTTNLICMYVAVAMIWPLAAIHSVRLVVSVYKNGPQP